jgi:hypothetical protein
MLKFAFYDGQLSAHFGVALTGYATNQGKSKRLSAVRQQFISILMPLI